MIRRKSIIPNHYHPLTQTSSACRIAGDTSCCAISEMMLMCNLSFGFMYLNGTWP